MRKVPEEWDTSKVTPVLSSDGRYVPVPIGYTAPSVTGENSVNDGFVIYEGTGVVDDSNVSTAKTTRNQFVWIPVSSAQLAEMYTEAPETALSAYTGVDATTSVYGNLKDEDSGSSGFGGIPGSITYREPDILIDTAFGDASTTSGRGINLIKSVFGYEGSNEEVLGQFADILVANYEEAYKSIKEYGGFYIGRYELTGSVARPTVQKGKNVIVFQDWYNLYKACSNVVNTEFAKSAMIAGTQWDRVLEWIVDTGDKSSSEVYSDSSSWGNYYDSSGEAAKGSGEKRKSGYNEAWKANNIYDLAGNCYEWTLEAQAVNDRIGRGGYCSYSGSDGPASRRHFNYEYPNDSGGYKSTRVALYVELNAE